MNQLAMRLENIYTFSKKCDYFSIIPGDRLKISRVYDKRDTIKKTHCFCLQSRKHKISASSSVKMLTAPYRKGVKNVLSLVCQKCLTRTKIQLCTWPGEANICCCNIILHFCKSSSTFIPKQVSLKHTSVHDIINTQFYFNSPKELIRISHAKKGIFFPA